MYDSVCIKISKHKGLNSQQTFDFYKMQNVMQK